MILVAHSDNLSGFYHCSVSILMSWIGGRIKTNRITAGGRGAFPVLLYLDLLSVFLVDCVMRETIVFIVHKTLIKKAFTTTNTPCKSNT